jgi:signal transduction histidine kinase
VRRRILLLIAATTTLVVLAFAIPLAVLIRSQVEQHQRNATQATAQRVAAYVGGVVTRNGGGSTATTLIRRYVTAEADNRTVAVTTPDGTTIGSLPPGAEVPGRQPGGGFDGGPSHGGFGFEPDGPRSRLVQATGGQLAVAGVPSRSGPYLVQVYASDAQLHAGEGGWWLLLAGVSLGLLGIGVGAAELLTRRITRPLVRTAETANRLSTGEVTARAPTDGPREVAAVGTALNRLADRIDQLIGEERETVADLSHRLRTPLTALRLDAEALSNPDEAERVGAHVNVLERMLTAIIRAARRPEREGRIPSCDATAVVADRVRFWSALTEEQNRAASISLAPAPLPVRAAAEDLAAAVDALLETVVAHTPEGTPFSVRLAPSADGAVLEVGDAGPGIPPNADVRGRSDRGSTGLGLDIARRCAEAGGGSMRLDRSEQGGALVTLWLCRT